eukprot:scaffold5266_cov116-Isochrysis_galbana.AAC.3
MAARIIAAGTWRRWPMPDGHVGAVGGGGARCLGVRSGWPRGWRRVEAAATPAAPGRGPGCRWEPVDGIGARMIAAGAWRRWPMATAALLEAGGRVFEASERLAAQVAAGRGRSHTPSPRVQAGVPVGAGAWHRRANDCGWRVATVADGHVSAAGGEGARFRGVGAAGRAGCGGGISGWRVAKVADGHTAALLEAGGRVFEASERLAARVAAGRGCSHSLSPRAEIGVPVGASGWHRRAVVSGWRMAKVADGHGGAAAGGAARFRGVGAGWPRGWRRVKSASTHPAPGRRPGCRWEPVHGIGAWMFAATAALPKAGGRVFEASERLTARVAAGTGVRHAPQLQGGGRGAGGSRYMA